MGRASDQEIKSPHDHIHWQGDKSYTPPEYIYGLPEAISWKNKKFSADLYLLGNLVLFLLTGATVNQILNAQLNGLSLPKNNYKFNQPYLQHGFSNTMEICSMLLKRAEDRIELNASALSIIKTLCNPDPMERGWKGTKRSPLNLFNLEPYVSRLNVLASTAEYRLKRST